MFIHSRRLLILKSHIQVQLKDGKVKECTQGITVKEVATSIGSSLGKRTVGAKVNGMMVDVSYELMNDATVEFYTLETKEGVEVLRHTTAHVLAQAVKRLYPNVKLGIGPAIEHGFYYDFRLEETWNENNLQRIEAEMRSIIHENLPIEKEIITYEEAMDLFTKRNEPLKLELLEDMKELEALTIYRQGEFVDLCRGPHLPSTGYIKAFQLSHVSGAYWRGDSNQMMLQRIYGYAFPKQIQLKAHLDFLEEARKRDHRKLGKQLQLFMFSDEAPGMPFYLPKGQIIRNELEKFSREVQSQANYDEVRTPLMMNQRLWEQSGHWDHYHENMYFTEVDKTKFAMKPMNCPGHMLMYKNNLYSYRDLPIRISEFGQVHRHEYSGALNGMLRVRTFCQDDAHIFVRKDQIEAEIAQVFQLIDQVYQTFGFTYDVELSTRPEKSMGEDHLWQSSEQALQNVLQELEAPYQLNEGDGAFYGPKIDFHIKDALGRSHQCATIQLDFQMPENFDLSYIDERNEKVRPVVIHRAIYGSLDRFFGILVEHFAGVFPVWLALVQVQIIPVSKVHEAYCKSVAIKLKQQGIRVEIDNRDEKLGYKIREAQMQKVPYTLVLGDDEVEKGSVNIRKYGSKASESEPLARFLARIKQQVEKRSL